MSRSVKRLCAPVCGIAAVVLAGCHAGHDQSAVHPASPEAASIATLWWVMFAVLAGAFVIVMALTLFAISRAPRKTEAPGGARRFVVISGIVIPTIILLGMLLFSLRTALALRRPLDGPIIEVTGFQWWWEVRYPQFGIVTANEIHLPAGQPVRLKLRAHDVVHSFWVPNLHGKIDLLPEVVNTFWIRADRPGTWRGQCAEFCGQQHATMGIRVVALPPEEFERWAEEHRFGARAVADAAAAPAGDTELARGEQVFFRGSCHVCHAVAGTPAHGRIGPDLTHIGSRLTLGAGAVENTRENLERWILDPQAIKPGSYMPATPLEREDLDALLDYLEAQQ